MRDDNHFENLFEKLINKRLSKSEMAELSDYFIEHSPSGTVDNYFLRVWNTSHHDNADIQSDLLINKIYQKAGFTSYNRYIKTSQSLYGKIIRYAAIFIVAFGFSWFLINQLNTKSGTAYNGYTGKNEVMVAYGSKSKIRLPDGSVVKLNSGSKLSYPAVFKKDHRQVDLEGEAYFEIKTDASRPFFVNASEIIIKVTGTAFNVKSYPESNIIETTLLSGSLEIFEKRHIGGTPKSTDRSLVLKPNQEAIYIRNPEKFTSDDQREFKLDADTATLSKLTLLDSADIPALVAWNDNKLVFNDERFEELIIKLERWFNASITINSQKLKKERFTGTFENETIEQVLEALKMAELFDYTIVKNEIMIFKNKL